MGYDKHGSSMFRLHKPLPPFQDIFLFQDEREIQDSRSTMEVELQTLTTPSPAKALAASGDSSAAQEARHRLPWMA